MRKHKITEVQRTVAGLTPESLERFRAAESVLKPLPVPMISRLKLGERYLLASTINSWPEDVQFKDKLQDIVSNIHHDDAIDLLTRARKRRIQGAEELLYGISSKAYGKIFAGTIVDMVKTYGISDWKESEKALGGLNRFPEDQRRILIQTAIFDGSTNEIRHRALGLFIDNSQVKTGTGFTATGEFLEAIDRGFYDPSGFEKMKRNIRLIKLIPVEYWPRIIECIINRPNQDSYNYLEAVKMASELGNETEKKELLQWITASVIGKSSETRHIYFSILDRTMLIDSMLPLLPEDLRIEIFDALLDGKESALVEIFGHVETLPDHYKTEKFFNRYANAIETYVKHPTSYEKEVLKVLDKLDLFPPKSRSKLVSAAIDNSNILKTITVLRHINGLPNADELWERLRSNNAFVRELTARQSTPSGHISALGELPAEYRAEVLCKMLKTLELGRTDVDHITRDDEMFGMRNLAKLMEEIPDEHLFGVIRAGLKSPMKHISVLAFSLRSRLGAEYDYQGNIVADALCSRHEEVSSAAFEILQTFPIDKQEILLMHVMGAGSAGIRKKSMEYALSLNRLSS